MNIEEILQNEIVQSGLVGAGVILFTFFFAFLTHKFSEIKSTRRITQKILDITLYAMLTILFIFLSVIVGSVFISTAK